MTHLQISVILIVFAAVILAIAFNWMDTAAAALLGVSIMLLFGVFTRQEFLIAAQTAGGSLALLFGGTLGGNVTLIGTSAKRGEHRHLRSSRAAHLIRCFCPLCGSADGL